LTGGLPSMPMGYDQHWNFGVQQGLGRHMVLEVDYVGNKGVNLYVGDPINDAPAGVGAVQARRPFETNAICILPDHLHAIRTLPPGDADFGSRWSQIKSGFSRERPAAQLRSRSRVLRRETGIWQRRFWEHAMRDDADFERHVDYIHSNPVKHGYVTRVCDWPYSSFHRYVRNAVLPADWGGDLAEIEGRFGE